MLYLSLFGGYAPKWAERERVSSADEIRAVYEGDIAKQTKLVISKQGYKPFYNGFRGFSIHNILPHQKELICMGQVNKVEVAPDLGEGASVKQSKRQGSKDAFWEYSFWE